MDISTSPLLETVKEAVQNPSKCTPDTVLLLRRLLSTSGTQNSDERDKSTNSGSRPPSRKTVRATRPRAATKVSVYQGPASENDSPSLSKQEKLVLATDVFNASSKSLSGCTRTQAPSKSRRVTGDKQEADDARRSTPKSPLQSTSPNKRIIPSPARVKRSGEDEQKPDTNSVGVSSVADCARLALSSLRALRKDESHAAEFNVQLEQGLCVLVGKLLVVGLNDMAAQELRKLGRRIKFENGRRRNKCTKNVEQGRAVNEPLEELLQIGHVSATGDFLQLLVSFQAHVVRAIAAERKPSTVNRLPNALVISNPSSPVNLIVAAYDQGLIAGEKTAQQLQSLSYTVLSLSPASGNSTESKQSSCKARIKPTVILNLQLLSLEIRCISWRISGRTCDEAKELWEPLARYFTLFSRRCLTIRQSDNDYIKETFQRFQSTLGANGHTFANNSLNSSSLFTTFRTLGQLSHSAGRLGDAIKYCETATKFLSADRHLQFAFCNCKVALISIESMPKRALSSAAAAIDKAAMSLAAPLRGSQSDMEELLIESARLKKAAMSIMATVGNPASANENQEKGTATFRISTAEYLINFVRLLNRYLLPPAPHQGDTDSNAPCERLQKFKNIASAAVDSGISIGKISITTGLPPWTEIEPLLSDCLRLLVSIQDDENPQIEPAMPNSRPGYLKLSNLYWSLYVSRREKGNSTSQLVQVLERSVSILQRSSLTEQSAGIMATKLEKLAGSYSDMGQTSKSNAAYIKSIRAHLDAGVLESVDCDFSERHPSHIWRDSKCSVFPLGRVLHAYIRAGLQKSCKKAEIFYDDREVGKERRAILLERQMMIMMGPSFSALDVAPHFMSITSALLSLYPVETYPIRRMRVVLQALRFILDSGGYIEDSFRDTVVVEAKKSISREGNSGADCDLSHLREYTESALRLALGFVIGHLPVDTLAQVVKSWVVIVQSCEGLESLEARVDDISTWMAQARAVVDYLEAQGLWKLKIGALAVIRQVLEYQPEQVITMVSCLSQIGLEYCRLGYSEQARTSLTRAEVLIKQNCVPPLALLTWHLAYAEYLLAVEKMDGCVEILFEAQSIFEDHSADLSRGSSQRRCLIERFTADAASLLSRLSLLKGDLGQATYYAKGAVRLTSRIWARLDRCARRKQDRSGSDNPEQDVDSIANRMAAIDLSSADAPVSEDYYRGSLFWPHFASHCGSLVHLSRVAARNGLFQDAMYYGEQASEISKSIGSKFSTAIINAELGRYQICAGQLQKGDEMLCMAVEESKNQEQHLDSILLNIHRSTWYRHSEESEDEDNALAAAYQTLTEISKDNFMRLLDPFDETHVAEIESKVKELSIGTSRNGRALRTQPRGRENRLEKRSTRTKKPPQEAQFTVESLLFSNLQGDILCRRARASLSSQNLSEAEILLGEASKYALSEANKVNHSICRSEHLLASALHELSSHGVYCVLRESTISLPSIHASGVPISQERSTSSTRKTRATTSTRRTKKPQQSPRRAAPVTGEESTSLSRAKDVLTDISASTMLYGSTKDNHDVSFLSGRVSMLSYATTPEHGAAPGLLTPAYAIELGRNTAFQRESTAIFSDKQLCEPSPSLKWPAQPIRQPNASSALSSNSMEEYVDMLPSDWQAISLTLSADRSEFLISRLRAGQTPFLLCLPLKRADPEDVDEEDFTFGSGKDELLEVIRLANESAHASEARFDKKSKKQWWENREALDERLRQLLYNIETIWFGGFRGIFASKPRSDDLLSGFIDSFQKIMDKHLPSRRKRGKGKIPNSTLDRNVMELFVNIGSLDDDANPEDSVMDLLYFVVDILQFHGERNAYDEIDFDMMVVETLDALRGYHDADRREQVAGQQNHTILILDKSLHSFPWESMDCLQGSPVSRIPSLDCLRDRIIQSQSTHSSEGYRMGFHINRNSGSYILNPSGDLKSTQSSLEAPLSSLDDWTSVIQREPSEEEFKDSLENKDLFLYFGHGSGAQYIRGRTIKRLDRCAVTFLMGCSSGSMTQAGEFESYGTPWNYMHAGAPALVATLWDVTDKDIDRFATSVFEQWGLVDASSSDTESPVGRKSRSQQAGNFDTTAAAVSGSTSLDAVVASSRGACILRYLNGAAPVVYGVPVFLK